MDQCQSGVVRSALWGTRKWILCCSFVLLTGCFIGDSFVPVEERPQPAKPPAHLYIVSEGDTLYSIAWRYGMDFRRLAAANSIGPPYVIRNGQKLRLEEREPAQVRRSEPVRRATSGGRAPAARSKPAPTAKTSVSTRRISWNWPSDGKVTARFSTRGRVNKGIDIAGKLGEAVKTAAPGKVVYAGSGIRGYGKLIIIKHNDRYLSAYAHNRRILVAEEQEVRTGQKIAEMGERESGRSLLHFEIRREGKPVDPLAYLPPRNSRR